MQAKNSLTLMVCERTSSDTWEASGFKLYGGDAVGKAQITI